MEKLHNGQCGLCVHFGETHPDSPSLLHIRKTKESIDELVEECGHPQHAALNLIVTPISGCKGFEPAIVELR